MLLVHQSINHTALGEASITGAVPAQRATQFKENPILCFEVVTRHNSINVRASMLLQPTACCLEVLEVAGNPIRYGLYLPLRVLSLTIRTAYQYSAANNKFVCPWLLPNLVAWV